jgi:hypothetical protein
MFRKAMMAMYDAGLASDRDPLPLERAAEPVVAYVRGLEDRLAAFASVVPLCECGHPKHAHDTICMVSVVTVRKTHRRHARCKCKAFKEAA